MKFTQALMLALSATALAEARGGFGRQGSGQGTFGSGTSNGGSSTGMAITMW